MRYLFLLFISLTQLSCSLDLDPLYHSQSYVFGTLVDISIYGEHESEAQHIAAEITRQFQSIHNRLHAWKPSELNGINTSFADGKPKLIEQDMADLLADAIQRAQQSDELFNPAIGHLVKYWGFQSDNFPPHRPDPQTLAELVAQHASMHDIVLENHVISSRNPHVKIDLGGYAKGYALDMGLKILKEFHVKNALINIGGNVIAIGQHGDRPWTVGIQHPRRPNAIASLALESGWAIGTSGDYQRYFMLEGKRYCHIIDPRTGWPAQGTQSVTVLIPPGKDAGIRSDVSSKPIFISAREKKAEYAKKMDVDHVLIIQDDGEILASPAMQKKLQWLDKEAQTRVQTLE